MSKQWNCHHKTWIMKLMFWSQKIFNLDDTFDMTLNAMIIITLYYIISYYRMEFYKSSSYENWDEIEILFGHEVSCILEFAISNKQFVIGILPDQSFLTEWEDYRVSSGPFWDLIWNWRLEFFEICLLKILERARSDLSLTFFWMFDRIHCFGD